MLCSNEPRRRPRVHLQPREVRADNHLGMEFDWFALTRDYCIYNSNAKRHILTSKRVFVTPTLEVVWQIWIKRDFPNVHCIIHSKVFDIQGSRSRWHPANLHQWTPNLIQGAIILRANLKVSTRNKFRLKGVDQAIPICAQIFERRSRRRRIM